LAKPRTSSLGALPSLWTFLCHLTLYPERRTPLPRLAAVQLPDSHNGRLGVATKAQSTLLVFPLVHRLLVDTDQVGEVRLRQVKLGACTADHLRRDACALSTSSSVITIFCLRRSPTRGGKSLTVSHGIEQVHTEAVGLRHAGPPSQTMSGPAGGGVSGPVGPLPGPARTNTDGRHEDGNVYAEVPGSVLE